MQTAFIVTTVVVIVTAILIGVGLLIDKNAEGFDKGGKGGDR